ncbi:MAG: hypothetical protein AB1689_04210 [Thermodesulfobacteriota bacterium]
MNTKSNILKTLAAAVAALVLALPVAASADSAGIPGKILGFEHNGDESDDAGLSHGVITVDEGNEATRQYHWGGSFCLERDLDIQQQQLLVTAIAHRMAILPYYKLGNGNTRCLVSFVLTRPAYVEKVQK